MMKFRIGDRLTPRPPRIGSAARTSWSTSKRNHSFFGPSDRFSPETLLRQHLVNELDADGALAHGGGDALDASGAHVPDSENAAPVRLEEERWPADRPPNNSATLRFNSGNSTRPRQESRR
jgi:hypothetical protein